MAVINLRGLIMIRIKLRSLLDDKSVRDRRRITLNEVAKETGISRTTINRIANVLGYNVTAEAINALCKYFDCTPCELLEYLPDEEH